MENVEVYIARHWHEFNTNQTLWRHFEPDILVVPTTKLKVYPANVFTGLSQDSIYTIPDLIRLYLKNARNCHIIGKHGLECILSTIIGENSSSYLKMEQYKQGYVKALTDFIHHFRSTSVTDLASAIIRFKGEQLSLKEKDLVKIYNEFERILPDYGYDLRRALEDFLLNATPELFFCTSGSLPNTRIAFFGFDYINPLEEAFVNRLLNSSAKVAFFTCKHTGASEQALRIQKSVTGFLERINNRITEHLIPSLPTDHFFDDLSDALFEPVVTAGSFKETPLFQSDRVYISPSNNRLDETVAIARRIKDLIHNGVSLGNIRIVAPEYDLYLSTIREIFPEYGIPFYPEEGVSLLRFPLAALILHLVSQSVNVNPYSMRDKIFLSPYISYSLRVTTAALAEFQQIHGVEFVSADALTALLDENTAYRLDYNFVKHTRLKAYQTVNPPEKISQLSVVRQYLDGLDYRNSEDKQRVLFHSLLQFYLVSRSEKELSLGHARMNPFEFRDRVLHLFSRFHIEDNIRSIDNHPGSLEAEIMEQDLLVLDHVKAVLTETANLMIPLMQKTPSGLTLFEMVRTFSRLMNETNLFHSPKNSIMIQPVDRLQYQKWDYTFLCGLIDGEFPKEEVFNFLHPKKEGLNLGSFYTTVDHARNYFYHLVSSTSQALFISHPLSHNGRKLSPSPFLKDLRNCHQAVIPKSGENLHETDRIYSRREKYLAIGKNIDQHYETALPLLKEIRDADGALFSYLTAILRHDGLTSNTVSLSEFDGIFSGNPNVLKLLMEDCKNIVFTPALLECYAICPMRFFFDNILHLKEEPDYHPDTSESGLLVRSILKEYTTKAAQAKGIPDDAATLFNDCIMENTSAQYQTQDAFATRFIHSLSAGLPKNQSRRPGLFYAFLEYEKNAPDRLNPHSAALSGTVRFPGTPEIYVEIDRVDLTRDARNFLLYLYTTGQIDNPGKIGRGLRFDLPLAILLFREIIKDTYPQTQIAGAGQYLVKSPKALKRGGYFAKKSVIASRQVNVCDAVPIFSGQREGLISDEQFEFAIEMIKTHITKLFQFMEKGVFHPSLCDETDQNCRNCTFAFMCRKDKQRLDQLRIKLACDDTIPSVKEIF